MVLGSDPSADCKTEVAGVTAADDAGSGLKRPAPVGIGSKPAAKRTARVEDWSVDDVLNYIRMLSLEHVQDKFRENAVDGLMLLEVSEEDLRNELGLTPQARKVKSRLPN